MLCYNYSRERGMEWRFSPNPAKNKSLTYRGAATNRDTVIPIKQNVRQRQMKTDTCIDRQATQSRARKTELFVFYVPPPAKWAMSQPIKNSSLHSLKKLKRMTGVEQECND